MSSYIKNITIGIRLFIPYLLINYIYNSLYVYWEF